MVMCKCCQGYATLCRVLTNAWMIAAVVFSGLSLSSCEFVKRGNATFGMFQYGTSDDGCGGSYENGINAHGWLHAWAGVCGVLAPILGGIVIVLMALDCCCKVCCSSAMGTFVLSCAQICQVFTFLFYASNACVSSADIIDLDVIWGGCVVGQGSVYSLIALGCYFLGGCFLCFSPKPDPIHFQKNNDDAETPVEKKEEQPAQAVVQDEENAPAADPQTPPEQVKPQVY